ncbi:hypothetical protein P280DRAFT_512057 [Massarina eburnea CBS 473.64]|uniref:Myb-like domain-containing protein n=1 Tax=Massarina eburnea CBS 473.64 TaxID=1395130 RepID=A0A6A6RGP0_9PLEO|nr:hypothetical protein P280DRAFT_512057 [Massarina eburnea CBS 473.64]
MNPRDETPLVARDGMDIDEPESAAGTARLYEIDQETPRSAEREPQDLNINEQPSPATSVASIHSNAVASSIDQPDPDDKSKPKSIKRPHWTETEHMYIRAERAKEPPSTWEAIGLHLGRRAPACHSEYRKMVRDEQHVVDASFAWTDDLDAELLRKRAEGKSIPQVAEEMKLPFSLLVKRNIFLRTRKEGVTTSTSSKATINSPSITPSPKPANKPNPKSNTTKTPTNPFTPEEDEVICRLDILLLDTKTIASALPGKAVTAVMMRKRQLTRHGAFEDDLPDMYARLMWGWNRGGKTWTREDVEERRFVVGEWKGWGTMNDR